ncbi:toll-like receptor 5 isoform X1 [Poecilia latipinna]|uniref:toll-like receptor 5 isoform X1 n=1 Tax=Poecilia latipinna TaxID=48699 RepID=UPI00072DE5F5|nr:PREDICTED: toll-like receptor 5 isoform X1 [Poecilia latipinna]XP_014883844.1 PREDICTED: toll-like receptor 5 isoform X1 [Poecilia latipinna]
MWLLVLQLICAGFYLQPATCHPSCQLWGQKAYCTARNLIWVPVLPPNLTHLYLDINLIHEINRTSLRDLKELQELDLGSQKVVLTIRNDSFLRQRKLTTLVLGDNVGLKLEPRAFAGLVRLRDLWLDYCSLTDYILAENYLKPLLSLERLNLYGNNIVRLNPGQFFWNLTKFSKLILDLNQLEKICEKDLVGFQGKYFHLLSLRSNSFFRSDVDWKDCGNPFKEMAFNILDISGSGMNLETLKLFFRAIRGTPIAHLKCSGSLGKDFSYNNRPDPDKDTFQDLEESSVVNLDLSGNRIFALKTGVFRALKDVGMIDISRNKINVIETNAFIGLERNLLQLNLSSNLLGEIRSDTFSNLTELLILDLSNNHIGVLGDKAFSGLSQLHHLYLTGNALRQLASPAPLPNLEFLLLKDNKLNSIRSIISLWNSSKYLDISENRLTNLEGLYVVLTHFKRLLYFFYGGNTILWCTINPGVSMPPNNSLVVLDLHDSSLQISWAQGHCLDIFDNLQNLIGLNISFNSLMTLPHGVFRGLTSIRNIDLSFNALTYLEASVFPASLKSLSLSNNFLVSPDPMTFHSLSALDLSGNRFHCDCGLEDFLKWLNMTNVTFLSPAQEYRCEFPASFHNLPLLEFPTIMESCEDEEKDVQAFQLALFISSAILVFSLVLSRIIYARLQGQIFIIYKKVVNRVLEGPKPPAQENNWQYDAFLCFSNSDYRWVEAALLKKLDNQFAEENLFHCCFEARDFLPGEDHLSNIRDAIWGSRKTLCIVSKEFLKDGWCLEAFTLAQGRMLEELTNVLVMLVVGKVAHYQLMKCNAVRAFVQRREYLTWPEDPQDLEWFYERLVSLILRDTKVKKFAEDKPESVKPDCQPPAKEKIPLENIRVNNLAGNPLM